jgi:hypothetical protein
MWQRRSGLKGRIVNLPSHRAAENQRTPYRRMVFRNGSPTPMPEGALDAALADMANKPADAEVTAWA